MDPQSEERTSTVHTSRSRALATFKSLSQEIIRRIRRRMHLRYQASRFREGNLISQSSFLNQYEINQLLLIVITLILVRWSSELFKVLLCQIRDSSVLMDFLKGEILNTTTCVIKVVKVNIRSTIYYFHIDIFRKPLAKCQLDTRYLWKRTKIESNIYI